MDQFYSDFMTAILNLNKGMAMDVFHAYEAACPGEDFFDHIARKVLEEIGASWSRGQASLAQVYMSGTICEALIEEKYGPMADLGHETSDIAVVTLDDFHPLGKKLLTAVLKAHAIKAMDMGYGLKLEEIVDRLEKDKIKLLLISVLMLPSALRIKDLKDAMDRRHLETKIMVGGSPFRLDPQLWRAVRADYVGDAPMDAVHLIRRMKGEDQ